MKITNLTAEKWQFIIDRVEKLPQGIHLWYKGVPYPRRVYYSRDKDINFTLRVLNALGVVKKYLFSLSFLLKLVFPRTFKVKKYEPFLRHLFGLINWVLEEFWIKDDEYSIPVWEFGKFTHRFLWELGLNMELAANFTRVIMMILEFDNAYRYRLQDLLGEIYWLDRKTLKYIFGLYLKRDTINQNEPDWGARGKFRKIFTLFRIALWLPKVKRALRMAHQGIDWDKFKLDDNDRYHTSWWRGYDYGGKDFDERYKFFLDAHKGDFPPFVKREDPNLIAKFLTGE